MFSYQRFSLSLVLGIFLVVVCSSVPPPQSPLHTLNSPQGGIIVYGLVNGAASPATAMAEILRNVHNSCGERPQVGNVFRVRGTNSDAVFFTVVNHPGGNVQVAGMLIAAPTGTNKVEAGLVSDAASRFGSTMSPMLSQLFSVWHPGGVAPPMGRTAAPAAGGGGSLPPTRQVTLPDNTASLSLPAGWNIDQKSGGGGGALVNGPNGEHVVLNNYFMAQDPYSQVYQNELRMRSQSRLRLVVYPRNADLANSFPDVFQRLRAFNGLGPAPLQVARVQQTPGSQGNCVDAEGQVNPYGQGMVEMKMLLCRTPPNQYGSYFFVDSQYQVPLGASDQQRATAAAIMASFQVNTQLVESRATAEAAPYIAQMKQNWQAHEQAMQAANQRAIGNIQQIGANATARMNATEAANSAQWGSFDRHEDNISRQGQGFSNYILDQTVVQDNNMYGEGTVGHGTVWNSEADALVKANPHRFEIVNTPGYWQGVDY